MNSGTSSRSVRTFLFILAAAALSLFYYSVSIGVSGGFNSSIPPQQQYIDYNVEMGNSNALGYNFTSADFSCASASGCTLVQIAACDNNLPNQFACINQHAYTPYYNHKADISGNVICPMFLIAGSYSCGCINNHCAEIYSRVN